MIRSMVLGSVLLFNLGLSAEELAVHQDSHGVWVERGAGKIEVICRGEPFQDKQVVDRGALDRCSIVSRVEYVLTVRDTSCRTCPASASDLRFEGKTMWLSKWFSEAEIVDALHRDTYFGKHAPPLSRLDDMRSWRTSDTRDCRDAFNYQFAFHHLKGDSVAVRIYLTKGCFGKSLQLGIYLPIPDSLKPAFQEAKSKGWLIENE